MTANEPIQGLPYPVPSDAPDGPNQIKALADAIATKLVMRFATTAARDAAIISPVEGMVAITGTGATLREWEYLSAGWRYLSPWMGNITGGRMSRPAITAQNINMTTDVSGVVTLDVSAVFASIAGMSLTAVTGTPKVAVIGSATPSSFSFQVFSGASPVASATFNARIVIFGEGI